MTNRIIEQEKNKRCSTFMINVFSMVSVSHSGDVQVSAQLVGLETSSDPAGAKLFVRYFKRKTQDALELLSLDVHSLP